MRKRHSPPTSVRPSQERPQTSPRRAGQLPPAPSFYDAIDEPSADDADYITSPSLPVAGNSSTIRLGLTQPLLAGAYNARMRVKGPGQVRARFFTSGDVDVGVSSYQAVTSSYGDITLPVTLSGTATKVQFEVETV